MIQLIQLLSNSTHSYTHPPWINCTKQRSELGRKSWTQINEVEYHRSYSGLAYTEAEYHKPYSGVSSYTWCIMILYYYVPDSNTYWCLQMTSSKSPLCRLRAINHKFHYDLLEGNLSGDSDWNVTWLFSNQVPVANKISGPLQLHQLQSCWFFDLLIFSIAEQLFHLKCV